MKPFELREAQGCFQTLMDNIFGLYLDQFVAVYSDDILIYGKSKRPHRASQNCFSELQENELFGITLKRKFIEQSIGYLGHLTEETRIEVDKK